MAIYTQNNKQKAVIKFSLPLLSKYQIVCVPKKSYGQYFTNTSFPNIEFRHNDTQAILDIVDGLQKALNYVDKLRGANGGVIKSVGGEPWVTGGVIRASYFVHHDEPCVTCALEEDGFFRWKIDGYFARDNDTASLRRVAGTLMRMIPYVKAAR